MSCQHEVKYGGLCALCGAVIEDEEDSSVDQIKMTHKDTGITVSLNEAKRLEQQDAERLLKARKLSLIVDLDQTILHATWEPSIADWVRERKEAGSYSVKDIRQFTLDGSPLIYSIKLRPGLSTFLTEMSKKYEMHIYTMGTRSYAEAVVKEIDPTGTLFHDRILSRDENGSMTKKRLERLFPSDTSKVVVLDDRGDVWDYSSNLIQIKPYEYFIGIGDINSPFAQPKKDIIPSAESLQPSKATVHKSIPAETENRNESLKINGDNTISKEGGPNNTNQQDNAKEESSIKQNGCTNHTNQQEDSVTKSNGTGSFELTTRKEKPDSKGIDSKKQESDKDATATAVTHQGEDKKTENGDENISAEKQNSEDEESDDIYSDTEDNDDNAPEIPPKNHAVFKVPASVKKPDAPLPNTHDTDDILRVIRKSLFDVHNIYFNDLLKRNQTPDVAIILNSLKQKVLRGVNVVFSGIIPLHQTRPEDSWIWRMASSFGANCLHELTGKVTHLIAANPGTDKALTARKHGNIKIVSPAWITDSVWNWERLDEADYLLPAADITPPEPEIEDPESTLLEIEFDWEDDEVDEALGSDDDDESEEESEAVSNLNQDTQPKRTPAIPAPESKNEQRVLDDDELEEDELFRADMDAVLGEDMEELLASDDDNMEDLYDDDEEELLLSEGNSDEDQYSRKREKEDDDNLEDEHTRKRR